MLSFGNGKGGLSINFKAVELQDKHIFDEFFKKQRYEMCECTFANLFIWRKGFGTAWTLEDGFLLVKAGWDGTGFMLQPFGGDVANLPKVMNKIIDCFAQHNKPFLMRSVSVETRAALEQAMPGKFRFKEDRGNCDYVYLAQDLIELPGRKYSSKKNHINYFTTHFTNYRYLPLTEDIIPHCIDSAVEWYEKRADSHPGLEMEKYAILEALGNFSYLGLQGGAIELYGKMEAFTCGEVLNNDTAVIHIEKGNIDVRGVYQIINREFCRHAWSNMTYINREEDMGIEGLRRAKESYHPVQLITKYEVTLA